MGLFFTKPTLNVPAVRQVFRNALMTNPGDVHNPDQRAEELATQVRQFVATAPELACRQVFHNALMINPANVHNPDQRAEELATQVQQLTPPEFSWGRFWAAVIFLLLIFGLGVLTAYLDKLQAWSTPLFHTFEVLLGGMVGMIVGESRA